MGMDTQGREKHATEAFLLVAVRADGDGHPRMRVDSQGRRKQFTIALLVAVRADGGGGLNSPLAFTCGGGEVKVLNSFSC